nr:calcium/sodium antiporter [Alteripontixanthobacter muriae]
MVAAGLLALVLGGEILVRGAVGLAAKAGVQPLVIGLVVVGFGTSMPELVTSVEASLAGSPAIAWGNIVGSNLANSLLILGIAALVTPIAIASDNRLRDPVFALAGSVLLALLAITGLGSVLAGLILLACLFAYIGWAYIDGRRRYSAGTGSPSGMDGDEFAGAASEDGWTKPVMLTLLGLAILIGGGRMLVIGAIDLARIAGLTETLIGLTIVAIGTSLPELVTSVIAARKGEAGVAFGNVIGSNIYNIFGIGGAAMLLAPAGLPKDLWPADIGLVVASALAIFLLVLFPRAVTRVPAVALVALYAAYLVYLIVNA